MITLLHQLKSRAAKIQTWMKKYSRVKSLLRRWALELTLVEGQIESLELAAASASYSPMQSNSPSPASQSQRKTQRYQVKTGSEWHSTERRGAMVTVNGEAIYKVLKAQSQEWEQIGNKGKHGKWCVAVYEIPVGSRVEFRATANSRDDIISSFVVGAEGSDDIDVDGYTYGSDICGWIVSN